MKIMIATDAYVPQINGVVTTLLNTIKELKANGHEIFVIEPSLFSGIPVPWYKEIKMAYATPGLIEKYLDEFKPDAIHIVTEGPIGLATRRLLKKRGIPWSSSFHTKFADYVESYIGFGRELVWKWLKWVYNNDTNILVTTQSMKEELISRGFPEEKLVVWGRGVDDSVFTPNKKNNSELIWMNVGRISYEKNLEAFYQLDLPGRKIQVGDGPAISLYREKYPNVEFVGAKQGAELAEYYRNADVFVFPSKSDTFGLVMIESMRCGTPVAAYPVTGPIDVIDEGLTGSMDEDLQKACMNALSIPRGTVIKYSAKFSWVEATKIFLQSLTPIQKF